LRFSPKARDARLETGPNAEEGEANVKRAERKAIDAINTRDTRNLAKRRAEKPDRPRSN